MWLTGWDDCRLYLLYTTRELQAWRAITRASSEIPTLFRMKSQLENDPGLHQLAVRAFWSCYVIEKYVCLIKIIIYAYILFSLVNCQ